MKCLDVQFGVLLFTFKCTCSDASFDRQIGFAALYPIGLRSPAHCHNNNNINVSYNHDDNCLYAQYGVLILINFPVYLPSGGGGGWGVGREGGK